MFNKIILILLVFSLAETLAKSPRNPRRKKEPSVRIFVNNIAPYNNPTETYRYYMLPFCEPSQIYEENQSLGESLSGDRKMNSLYNVTFAQNTTKTLVCEKKLEKYDLRMFKHAIEEDYVSEFYIEDIPTHDMIGMKTEKDNKYLLKNHIEFNIFVDKYDKLIHANITAPVQNKDFFEIKEKKTGMTVPFYYSVNFYVIDPEKVQFYDYMETPEDEQAEKSEIHWLSIINSFLLIIMLVALVFLIMQKTVRKDVNSMRDMESDNEDVAWKMIRTEALLPPSSNKLILSVLVGTGIQFLYLVVCLTVLGIFGLYYGHHKGNQKTFGILLYAFTGIFNGFYSSKHYKLMGGKHWALAIVVSCVFYPGILFAIWSVINSIAWYSQSTAAVPFRSVLFIVMMWIIVYIPLTILGGITGRMKHQDDAPNPNTSLPRLYKPMPPKKIYQHPVFQFFIAGFLPFISIYLELNYVVQSVWGHHVYHLYSILFFAFIMFILVHVCVTICLTYFQLNSQDYNWWWRSFINGGSVSVFLMIYSIYFYFNKSHMHGIIQGSFYFGYMSLFSVATFMMMGSLSFVVSKKFVFYIYSQAKLD